MRKPTGDHNIRCLNLHHGLTIRDEFMDLIEKCDGGGNIDDTWNLIDPHTKKITTVGARDLWQRILETKNENRRTIYLVLLILVTNICMIFKEKRFNH